MKKIVLFLIFSLSLSCNSLQDKYFGILKGEWQIVKFYHKNKDLMLEEFSIIGFESRNDLWLIRRVNGESHFTSSYFKIYKDSTILKMDTKNCEDSRLNGDYDLYIDTIQDNEEDYILRMRLDSEDTYIQAIRSKLKYYYPPKPN